MPSSQPWSRTRRGYWMRLVAVIVTTDWNSTPPRTCLGADRRRVASGRRTTDSAAGWPKTPTTATAASRANSVTNTRRVHRPAPCDVAPDWSSDSLENSSSRMAGGAALPRRRLNSCPDTVPRMTAFDLNGRVALVTGAARGIGLETARALHARGATVVLVDLDRGAAEAAAPRSARTARSAWRPT